MSDFSAVLRAAARGDRHAAAELLPLVYDELRALAAAKVAAEPVGQSLDPTALVHEAYLRLAGAGHAWSDKAHFLAVAASAMRRVLVDHARKRGRRKRGGGWQRVPLDALVAAVPDDPDDLVALDEALAALAAEDQRKARLVELRYFAGMPEAEAADALGVSRATAARHWAYAKAWLYDRMRSRPPE